VAVALPRRPSSEDRKDAGGACWEEGSQPASVEVEASPPCHREELANWRASEEGEEDLPWEEVGVVLT